MKMPLKNSAPEERDFVAQHASAIDALRAEASGCPHPDLLSAAMLAVLPDDQVRTIQAHVASCRLCTALREGFESVAPEEVVAEPQRLRRVWDRVRNQQRGRGWFDWPKTRLIAAAAAILLVVVGIGTLLNWPEPLSGPDAPPASAVTPAAPRAFVLPLEKADLKLPLDSLTWRGSEGSAAAYLSALGEALQPYYRGEFAGAVQTLMKLEGRYPEAVEPSFYKGVSQLFLNQPDGARTSLERARKLGGAALVSDIEWYMAIANEREGRVPEAASILADLCAKESPYRSRACELHPRLKP